MQGYKLQIMKKTILSVLALTVFAFPLFAFAQTKPTVAKQSDSVTDAQRQLDASANQAGINSTTSLDQQIATIVKLVLGFLGIVFLILTIIAGFKWMTAGGDAGQVKTAQQSMTNATIGLGIILFSYLISNYVVFSLFEALSNKK